MATRSLICAKDSARTFAATYCHFDGYPEHNGRILLRHYDSPDLASALVAGGDMQMIGEDGVPSRPKAHGYGEPPMACVPLDELGTRADDVNAEYVYVHDGEAWTCYAATDTRQLREIADWRAIVAAEEAP